MTQLIIIGAYLALLLCLGLVAGRLFRGTSQDYMLASHSIGPFLLLMSLFGTTMTAFALVGSTGESYKEGIGVYGMLASSSGIIHSLCFFVLGVRLWSFGQKYGYRTQIQYFRDRLSSDRIGLLLFPVLVGLVIPYLLLGVMASGVVINKITAGRVDRETGQVERGTFEEGTFPDFLEQGTGQDGEKSFAAGSCGGVPKQVASAVICVIVLMYVFFGGMRGTAWANAFQTLVFMVLGVITFYCLATKLGGQDGFLENLRAVSGSVPEEKLTRTHISKVKFLTYMFVPLSVGMFPHLFQHWLTAKSANSFKLSVVVHPIFIMIVWVPCVLIGAWATGDLVRVPPSVTPNAVLPFMVKSQIGPILTGFLTAGILAAIMSSLDSQFLCIGTMFTEDIAVHYVGRDRISDRQEVLLARIFIIAIVIVTYILSVWELDVFPLGVWCFSGFSSLFPLVFASLYWRRLTKAGAYASILAAAGTWAWLFSSALSLNNLRGYTLNLTLDGETYELMPVAGMILASTVAIIVVSLVTRPPADETLARFFPEKATAS